MYVYIYIYIYKYLNMYVVMTFIVRPFKRYY